MVIGERTGSNEFSERGIFLCMWRNVLLLNTRGKILKLLTFACRHSSYELCPSYHSLLEALAVFESQLFADYLQISDWVYIPLHVGHILILKCPCSLTQRDYRRNKDENPSNIHYHSMRNTSEEGKTYINRKMRKMEILQRLGSIQKEIPKSYFAPMYIL